MAVTAGGNDRSRPGAQVDSQLRRVRLRLATVVVIIFVFVSSGAFGLEDMVGWSGPGTGMPLSGT